MTPARPVEIANRHPRLRLRRAALKKLIAALDTHFRVLPGDFDPRLICRGAVSPAPFGHSATTIGSTPRAQQDCAPTFHVMGSEVDVSAIASATAEGSLLSRLARAAVSPRPKSATLHPRPAVSPGSLSLVFLTDAALAQLHASFLGDPTTTDVITFEGDPAHGIAGEICVSVDTAAAYASRHGRDFNAELTLYLVHGWLHLAGYDDLKPARKRVMRRAEARAMRILAALPDCGAVFSFLPLI